jgi:hypothetical protein
MENTLVLDAAPEDDYIRELFNRCERHKHELQSITNERLDEIKKNKAYMEDLVDLAIARGQPPPCDLELEYANRYPELKDYPDDKEEWDAHTEFSLEPPVALALMRKRIKQLIEIDKERADDHRIKKLSINGASVSVAGKVIAFVGSVDFKNGRRDTFVADIFSRKIWRGPTLPASLLNSRATHIGNGDVFVCGGFNKTTMNFSNRCWILNILSGRLTECPPMQTARSEHQAVFVESLMTVVVMGGSSVPNAVIRVEFFDVVRRKWSLITAKLMHGCSNFSATLIPNTETIILFGGRALATSVYNYIQFFDARKRQITSIYYMVHRHIHNHSAFVSGPKQITIVGGFGSRETARGKTPDLTFDFHEIETAEKTTHHDCSDQAIAWNNLGMTAVKHLNVLSFESPNLPPVNFKIQRNIHKSVMLLI